MIELKFFKPKDIEGSVKITVHKSGKLGFSKGAINLLKLNINKHCKFATNKVYENKDEIYLLVNNSEDEFSFKISKAGEYYYIKAKSFLSDLNIDYSDETQTIIFDIKEIDYQDQKIYKLNKRIVKKR